MPYTCYHCFRQKPTGGVCPFCGYDERGDAGKYPLALKPGSILNGRYTVGRVLGQGGFGITYIAQDYQSGERVAIKEYLPTDFAGREGGSSSVLIYSGERQENFEYGKKQFLEEARTLAAFNGDAHIVRIHSYFEENNTAYFVMEYVDGYALNKYLVQKGAPLSVEEANRLLLPLMGSLGKVHAKGIIHRDISPDNIIITKDGSAKLIDFGAARYSTGEKSKSLDVILKHGFAPKEQYTRRGRQGPFTDVYALAATYYYAITGKVPPEAIERLDEDNLIPPSSMRIKISSATEDALYKALEVNAADRYQNMADFYRDMADAAPKETEMLSGRSSAKTGQVRTEQEARNEYARLEVRAREVREETARLERERKAFEVEKKRTAEQKRTEESIKESSGKNKKSRRIIPVILILVAVIVTAIILLKSPVGSIVKFGHYEQDNDLTNGPEPIEWIVLDVQDGKALLLSKYGLDGQPYNTKDESVTWETCTLRSWLNKDFLTSAFNETEESYILTTDVDNSTAQGDSGWKTNGGNNTQDQIFLLSWKEANDYLVFKRQRICAATEYADSIDVGVDLDGDCQWWLRSPGKNRGCASSVSQYGMFHNIDSVNSSGVAVRPALWINLDSGIF